MGKRNKASVPLTKFMNSVIARLKANGQYRTMLHYRAALNSFMRFRQQQDVALAEMDSDMMKSYEAYLKNVAGVCRNTSSFYMRILRAVYNRAAEKGLAARQNPFRSVYTGIDKTGKRAIPTEAVSGIRRLATGLTPQQEMSRDTFLMCFYLRGISFIDLAHLRKSDLRDGYLHYTRSKTGQPLVVRWEKVMQNIVDKYKEQAAASPYLFPFLTGGRGKGHDEVHLYHNAESRITYHLKKLGGEDWTEWETDAVRGAPFVGYGRTRPEHPRLRNQRGAGTQFRDNHADIPPLHPDRGSGCRQRQSPCSAVTKKNRHPARLPGLPEKIRMISAKDCIRFRQRPYTFFRKIRMIFRAGQFESLRKRHRLTVQRYGKSCK